MSVRSHPRPPVDPAVLNGESATMWTNLGFWAGASVAPETRASIGGSEYPAAASLLARRVGEAARLSSGDVVADYACGFGDSLRLWRDEFGVQRVIGIEPDPTVCRAVEARVRTWGLSDCIRVVCASAENLAPRELASDVTAVVCVDAAYHFQTRRSWLAQLGANASPGLRLGLADLSVPNGMESSLRLRALARVMRVPHENLMSARSIAVACEDAGFTVNNSSDISVEVLDGFVAFAPRGTMSVAVTRTGIAYARRRQLLNYFVMGAQR